MKKRLISILLLITMLFTLLPAEATAVVSDNVNTAVDTVQEKTESKNPFADVREGNWYYDAVQYARINGFFSGTNENAFDPDGTMNRGMFVTVLARMAGVDQTAYSGQSAFSDVATDAYYAPFVSWASKNGIASGVGSGKFDPNGLVNREQMAVFFVRYFETFGVDYDTGALTVTGGMGFTSHGISIGSGVLTIESGTVNAVGKTSKGVSAIYASNGININGGTVTAIADAVSYGGVSSRGLESYGTISVTNGTVVASGGNVAMSNATSAPGMKITASTNKDGTNSEVYDLTKINTYKYIKIERES